MSLGWVVVIIVIVLGIIVSNIMLLRYSAKFKLPANTNDEDSQDGPKKQASGESNSKSKGG